MTSTSRRRLQFGSPECYPLPGLPDVTPSPLGKRFTAQQVQFLQSVFEMDNLPNRQTQQTLASSLAVPRKRIQIWFKNARAQKRQVIRLQKMTYREHDIQRWTRRMAMRRYMNGSPGVFDNRVRSAYHQETTCHVSTDLSCKSLHDSRDFVTPLPRQETVGCLSTPLQVQPTPMPQADANDWNCYAPVSDLSSVFCDSKPVCDQTNAFHDSSFKVLFGRLFDSLLKDERLI